MKKTGLNGYVYKFNVDYSDFSVVNLEEATPFVHNYFTAKYVKFVKKVFFIGLTILSNFTNVIPLSATLLNCISMKNQECKTRAQVVNV